VIEAARRTRPAAPPEEVMIVAFPFALIGAAFLAYVTVAARA
jgi:hypothetical protein